jgi:hypothetical protein
MTKDEKDEYRIKLTGQGMSMERAVTQEMARRITNLVMGGSVGQQDDVMELSENADIGSGITAKAFMTAKRPKTDIERIACLAFYLSHHKNIPQFKTRQLTDLNIAAAQPKLSNASFAARNAVSQEYLSLAGGGRKQITARGEVLVKALPDREKAKKALEEHLLHRRRRTKRVAKTV